MLTFFWTWFINFLFYCCGNVMNSCGSSLSERTSEVWLKAKLIFFYVLFVVASQRFSHIDYFIDYYYIFAKLLFSGKFVKTFGTLASGNK